MLNKDFYLASIKRFKPEFGFKDLLRLREIDDLDLQTLGYALDLPTSWIEDSDEWWKYQSELSQVLWCYHPLYPAELLKLENPPLFLFIQGTIPEKALKKVAMVGSREATRDVLSWMDLEIPKFLKAQPSAVISGGARGVDQKAHFLALRNQSPTWVFLPASLDRLYPSSWENWKKEFLAAGGILVTEYPRGVEMRKHHFVRRNQLIVGMSDYCFILQAARRSGSFLTAQMAQKSGLPLAALSHFPGQLKGLGCLDLIADGATLIRDHNDLLAWTSSDFKRLLFE